MMLPDVTVCKWLKLLFKVPWAILDYVTIYACSKRVTVHTGQHNLRPRPIIYIHAQQSGCGCGSALPKGPRHLLRSVDVAVNRQQHSYNYLEGGKDWSVSGTGICRILATCYNLDFQIWKLFQPALVSVINFHIWKSRLWHIARILQNPV